MPASDVNAMPEKSLKCDHGLRRHAIVESLIADVFQGRLKAGRHLVTQELSERFGVSHTPIREALISLAGIGIIDLLPNRGAIVRQVSKRDVREVCAVRRALECAAIKGACGRIQLLELNGLVGELEKLTLAPAKEGAKFTRKARELDNRLHDMIAASCGNTFLANEINRLKILFRAFRDVSWDRYEVAADGHRLAEEAHEHLAIVTALVANDRRAAARAMSQHIQSGVKYWSRALPDVAEVAPANGRLPGTSVKS